MTIRYFIRFHNNSSGCTQVLIEGGTCGKRAEFATLKEAKDEIKFHARDRQMGYSSHWKAIPFEVAA